MRNALTATLFVLSAGSALAQSAPVFAPNGQYLGTAVKNGNTTLFLDKNGKYGGAVVQNHNGMTIIDKNGQQSIRPLIGAPARRMVMDTTPAAMVLVPRTPIRVTALIRSIPVTPNVPRTTTPVMVIDRPTATTTATAVLTDGLLTD